MTQKIKKWKKIIRALSKEKSLPDEYRNKLPRRIIRIYDRIKVWCISRNVKHVYGRKRILFGRDEAIVLCLVKNGEIWIEEFIEHYLKKGFKHIVFLDNGSTDDTVKISEKHDNITVLSTTIPFKNNNILLRRYLIERFARNKWSLTVDIDELWDYPYSSRVCLRELLRYLREQGFNALIAHMLDMFMESVPEKRPESLKAYEYYDISCVTKDGFPVAQRTGFTFSKQAGSAKDEEKTPFYRGGIRAKIFGLKGIWLTKMPLIFYDKTIKPIAHQHFSNDANIAEITSVLFHYKFTNELRRQIKEAVKGEHYGLSSQGYKQLAPFFEGEGKVILKQNTAEQFKTVEQLIDSGFIEVTKEYENFAKRIERKEGENEKHKKTKYHC